MKKTILAALILLVVGALYMGSRPTASDAAQVMYFTTSDSLSVRPGGPIGFITIEAVSGAVGVKVWGPRYTAGEDSLIILSGDVLNIDLYKAGTFTNVFTVYPAGGATARGYYW